MKVGELVKHKWGTICGRGILVSLERNGSRGVIIDAYGDTNFVDGDRATVLWAGHVIVINAKWLEAV